MKQRIGISPMLLELIVTILFFMLSMSVVVRFIAAADETSRTSALTSRAMIAMENVAEELKADPLSDDQFDADGLHRFTLQEEDLQLLVVVQRVCAGSGILYEIEISATSGDRQLGSLSAARYISRGAGI